MGKTDILEEYREEFNAETGEMQHEVKRSVRKKKLEETDEFVKVSKYLHVIFAYFDIPLNLVPFGLLLAERMDYKTNTVNLIKPYKEEMAQMLGCTVKRIDTLIADCLKYDVIRRKARGVYEVNSYLFSCGSIADTKNLQAHFDIENDRVIAQGETKIELTGQTIIKTVKNYKSGIKREEKKELEMFDLDNGEV